MTSPVPENAHEAAWWAWREAWTSGGRKDGDTGQQALRAAVDASAKVIAAEAAQAERERLVTTEMRNRFCEAFSQILDPEDAADCTLRVVEIIRDRHDTTPGPSQGYSQGVRAERERWQVMMTAPVSCWCACGHSGHGPVHCVWAHEPPASRPRAHRIDDCPFADLLRGAG